MDRIRALLRFAGKGEQKVAAVFGLSRERCDRAVRYLRRGAPEAPVWLFSTEPPLPETAALCERVFVGRHSLLLLITAQQALWPRWVALAVSTWTGEHGRWPLKLAPFLIPPFRALLLNEHGDYFAGTPAAVLRHARRRLRDAVHSGWRRVKDVHRGAWLWIFALLAKRLIFLFHSALRFGHGGERLELALSGGGAARGVAEFRYRHRQWRQQELERLVASSNCRWILFLEGEAEPRIDDMLPLFAGARTFAVSRQAGFRDWKRRYIAMAPFRQLQPGEASWALAPVSNVMLVDRQKLAAIGIPKTVVPGTAWLIIFWKAAAAGLRSYSIGGARKLEVMPDWPFEEAAFAMRFLWDRSLRRLGPQEPDLSRGSIAFPVMAGPRTLAPSRPLQVLVISPYLPYPLAHGGAVRIYHLCRALSDRVDFLLACFREKGEFTDYQKLHEIFREIYVVDRDEKVSGDTALPGQVRGNVSRSLRALIAQLCREKRIDLLQVEYTHMAPFRAAAPQVPAILVEHDVTFTLYRQFAEQEATRAARREYQRWLAFERDWLRGNDAVWTMSEEDRRVAIEAGSHPGRTFVVANGVDVERFMPRQEPTGAPEIFYVGSFRHQPNLLGFEKLRQEVMPLVWRRFPQARLRVVAGPEPQRYWRRPARLDARIEMHGFVEDLRPLYAEATVVVVPLPVSAGTNIKVMEAMACGKALVATPVGCAGLGLRDGCDALVRAGWPAFADAVSELLADRELRARIAFQARRTVEQRFSWREIAAQAYDSYLKLTGVPAR